MDTIAVWISFLSNILIWIVGLILVFLNKNQITAKSWVYFLFFTALSSGVAAFGHLPLSNVKLSTNLLMISRVLSLFSVFEFTKGCILFSRFNEIRVIKYINSFLFVLSLVWLFFGHHFLPIMIYGMIGMLGIGSSALLTHFTQNKSEVIPILWGIALLFISAVIFAIFKNKYHFESTNISHIIVAISLVYFTKGFRQLKLN